MGRDQSAPEYLLLTQVAQTGKSHPGAQRAQPRQEAADRVRPPIGTITTRSASRSRLRPTAAVSSAIWSLMPSTSTTATALSTFARARAVARIEAAGPLT